MKPHWPTILQPLYITATFSVALAFIAWRMEIDHVEISRPTCATPDVTDRRIDMAIDPYTQCEVPMEDLGPVARAILIVMADRTDSLRCFVPGKESLLKDDKDCTEDAIYAPTESSTH